MMYRVSGNAPWSIEVEAGSEKEAEENALNLVQDRLDDYVGALEDVRVERVS